MKRYILFIFVALLGVISVLPVCAQQTQDALYIYRNDGKFHGFFFADINRIEYSKIDTLGVEQEDYVVQEVYALDSVFRIPISAIDSVAFVTPETQYKQDVAYTTESDLWSYVIASDSVSWILLRSDIPAALVPEIGQKLVTLNQTDILPSGFAGKVASVQNTDNGVLVTCEEVDLTEIFDRYVCKVDGVIDDNDNPSATRGEDDPLKVHLRIGELGFSKTITSGFGGGNFTINGNCTLGASIKPELDMRMFMAIDMNTGINFDVTTRGQFELKFNFNISGDLTGHFDAPLVSNAIPVPSFPLCRFKVEAGLFGEIQGSLNFGGSLSTTNRVYQVTQFNSLWEGNRTFILNLTNVKNSLEWSDVSGKVAISVGAYMQNSYIAVSDKILESGVRFNAGFRDEIEAQLKMSDFNLFRSFVVRDSDFVSRSRRWYDFWDRETKFTQTLFLSGQMFTSFGSKNKSVTQEITLGAPAEGGLLPRFGKTTVGLVTEATDSVHLSTPMDRSVPFGVPVGYDIYNDQGMLAKSVMREKNYYGKPEVLEMAVANLEAGKKYLAYPRVDFVGGTFYAAPSDSFTTDKAKFEVPVKVFNVSTDNGTVYAKINTNITNLVFTPKDKWLSCLWRPENQTLEIFHEFLPSSIEERKAIVHIDAKDGDGKVLDEADITINQVRAKIEFSTTELHFGVKGGTSIVTISATNTKNIEVSSKSSYIHPEINDKTISIVVDENPAPEKRSGSVVVIGTLESTGQKVERFISIDQDGTETPHEVEGLTTVDAHLKVTSNVIPNFNHELHLMNSPLHNGTLTQAGKYLYYRNSDAKRESTGDESWNATSWTIEATIDPVSQESMYSYKMLNGSVSYLYERYEDNKLVASERYSYNLKELAYVSITGKDNGGSISFSPLIMLDSWTDIHKWDAKLSDYMSDFTYERTGENALSLSQGDLNNTYLKSEEEQQNIGAESQWGIKMEFGIPEGTPLLEPDHYLIERDNGFGFSTTINYVSNNLVSNITYTSSDEWITIKDKEHFRWFDVEVENNTSKADREGYVYLEGTLADGSKLTRTITIKQPYRREDDPTIDYNEDSKPELPSQKVLDALSNAGMPLYLDNTPPELNGVYEMKPVVLTYSNFDDAASSPDVSAVFRLNTMVSSEPRALLCVYTVLPEYGALEPTERICYLSGDGNHFMVSNVYTVITEDMDGTHKDTEIIVCSGEIDGNNIVNFHMATIDLNENDEIVHISIGKDGDGVSTPTTWQPGSDPWDDENEDGQ